ncbi:hypothetical protein ACVW1C_005863 [Bradyrhizobium sp. USDA 4011]
MATIIAGHRPEEAFLGWASSRIEHRRRGFVHEQTIRRGQVFSHVIGDRRKAEVGPAQLPGSRDPVGPLDGHTSQLVD